ncbi:MAG: ribonuclease H-like domain-containing protein [Lachnospiraceae bacterium]|nr:ribonuclease H-like domain-containing protein [Lachnospiraceae bacterium]
MKEFKKHVDFKPGIAVRNYWESLGVKEEEVLFVDIETTGLSSKRDAIYQIGLAYKEEKTAGEISPGKESVSGEKTGVEKISDGDKSAEHKMAGIQKEEGRPAVPDIREDSGKRSAEKRTAENGPMSWTVLQWLCERRSEEQELLCLFFERLKGYRLLMHFNGTTFDLPFIRQRALKYKNHFPGFGIRRTEAEQSEFAGDKKSMINRNPDGKTENRETENDSEIVQYTPFDDLISVDMFRIFSPLASFLGLPNKKQKSFEAFLGIDREDEMSGGDLIPVYCEYETTGDERLEHYLMIHNHEDMKGMLRLTKLFAYRSLREGDFQVESFSLHEDRDFSGRTIHELTAKLRLDAPIEKRFVWRADGFYFEARGMTQDTQTACAMEDGTERAGSGRTNVTAGITAVTERTTETDDRSATAVIRLEEGVMKHFFSNYRDYDYLIKEDMAVYRTVGDLVDPSLRKRATAETCYMKRDGLFLGVGADYAAPLFRRTYKSKDVYVLAGETLDSDTVKSAVRKGLG